MMNRKTGYESGYIGAGEDLFGIELWINPNTTNGIGSAYPSNRF